jgi:hypothetical protein
MNLRFWRIFARRSRSPKVSSTSSISDKSAIAGVSVSVPEWIDRQVRSADNLSLAAEIAAVIVVIGIVVEDFDKFSMLFNHPSWIALRNVCGPVMVAGGVAFEILFSNRSSSKEGNVRDWYALRVAELNVETERLRKENSDTALLLAYRSVGNMSAFEEAMRAFSGTTFVLEGIEGSNEVAHLQWELNTALRKAGWIRRQFLAKQSIGFGVHILTVGTRAAPCRSDAAGALADWLDGKRVAVISSVKANLFFELGTVVLKIGPKPETIEQLEQIRSEYARQKLSRSVKRSQE